MGVYYYAEDLEKRSVIRSKSNPTAKDSPRNGEGLGMKDDIPSSMEGKGPDPLEFPKRMKKR